MTSRKARTGKRRSAAEGRALVAQYRASGESVAAFCRGTGVGQQVVRYWLQREAAGTDDGATGFFVVEKQPATTEQRAAPARRNTARERASAFIIVVPEASSSLLANTVRELLAETGS